MDREEIQAAIGTSRHMGDVIRQTIPGLRLRQSNNLSRTDICLEFRAAASISIVNARPCNHPKVYLDGVPVSDPQYLYGAMPLGDLERIQVIPPGEASTRYGSGSLYGEKDWIWIEKFDLKAADVTVSVPGPSTFILGLLRRNDRGRCAGRRGAPR